MSDPILTINVAEWVGRAQADPVAYQQRQAIAITLNGIAPEHKNGAEETVNVFPRVLNETIVKVFSQIHMRHAGARTCPTPKYYNLNKK